MTLGMTFATLVVLAMGGFLVVRRRSLAIVDGHVQALNSLPVQYGWFGVLCGMAPGLLVVAAWAMLGDRIVDRMVLGALPADMIPAEEGAVRLLLNDIHNIANSVFGTAASADLKAAADVYSRYTAIGQWVTFLLASATSIGGMTIAYRMTHADLRARSLNEKFMMAALVACSVVAVLTTAGIILSLLTESLRFFSQVSLFEFLFGTHWSPQTALREDQVGSSGAFGAIPLFAGTLLISLIALLVSVPVGLMSAIYMTQYASPAFRQIAKPLLEILAGVPTVVYGFFAALTVAPFIRNLGEAIGLDVASESALAAGLVMGIMIIPFMSSLSDDAITAVPQSMKDGSLALGATKSETIVRVLIPAALPGIVGAFLLAASRAIGETMIVVMEAGLAANLSFNPLEAVTTVTVQIVALLTGDQEFDSAKTLAAFALGLVLFCVTLLLNIIALRVVRKYRESYE